VANSSVRFGEMSRVGKKPVSVPNGVSVDIDGSTVRVKGPKGQLTRSFSDRVSMRLEGETITVERANDERETRALHGLSRALLANMIAGVSTGYRKELALVGVGYRAALKGKTLELAVGFSHPVTFPPPEGVVFEVPEPAKVVVTGIDKEAVGQAAANIRGIRPPEPYKGKGIRYVDEKVRRKAGKAGKR
jgi:large subunit ribosomal protein L6